MTAQLPDTGLEDESQWVMNANASLVTSAPGIVAPFDGTHFASLAFYVRNPSCTDRPAQGIISTTVIVAPEDAGLYQMTYHVGVDPANSGIGWYDFQVAIDDLNTGDMGVDLSYTLTDARGGTDANGWTSGTVAVALHDIPAGVYLAAGEHTVKFTALGFRYFFWEDIACGSVGHLYVDSVHLVPLFTPAPPLATIQVKHPNSDLCITTDSLTTKIKSAGVDVLKTPFPTITNSPPTIMGKDPLTNLPVYAPAPDQPASGAKHTPPANGTDCTQTRCGAALAMTQHLQNLYQNWQRWINAAVGVVGTASVTVILDWIAALLEGLVVAETIASSVLTIFNGLRPALQLLTGVELFAVLPSWDTTMVDNVQRVFFAALQCNGTTVTVTAGDMTNVAGYIRANTASFLGNIVAELLSLSCEYSALTDWQSTITGASPSTLCAGY